MNPLSIVLLAIAAGAVTPPDSTAVTDSTAVKAAIMPTEIIRLTDEDYAAVAEELGIEVATMKAVVEIEAGKSHQGFYKPGMPIINFDLTMFRRMATKRGVNLTKYHKSHPTVFARPNVRKHGSHQGAQHARLTEAMKINTPLAIEGTFWGMFQIGGFNWKKCGAASIEEFAERMSRSEREQLELFARFIENSGLLKHLQNKNWRAFARGYNGASYARRGYHTRLAAAYAKHSK